MKLLEIESWKDDLPRALEQAKLDVPALEQAFKDAEGRLVAAETERQRWQRTYGHFVSRIPLLQDKYKSAKRRVMTLEAETAGAGDSTSGWQVYKKLKAEWQQAVDTFAYLSLYPQPDADRALLVRQIEEREAYAALLEGRACRARAGVLVATAEAHKFDPGISLETSESWSNRESEKSHSIMTREIPALRAQLAAHDAQVAQQRADMNNTIWQ